MVYDLLLCQGQGVNHSKCTKLFDEYVLVSLFLLAKHESYLLTDRNIKPKFSQMMFEIDGLFSFCNPRNTTLDLSPSAEGKTLNKNKKISIRLLIRFVTIARNFQFYDSCSLVCTLISFLLLCCTGTLLFWIFLKVEPTFMSFAYTALFFLPLSLLLDYNTHLYRSLQLCLFYMFDRNHRLRYVKLYRMKLELLQKGQVSFSC